MIDPNSENILAYDLAMKFAEIATLNDMDDQEVVRGVRRFEEVFRVAFDFYCHGREGEQFDKFRRKAFELPDDRPGHRNIHAGEFPRQWRKR